MCLSLCLSLQYMMVRGANVQATVANSVNPDGTIDITLTTDNVAMYVVLTTRAHGRFSDNAFVLLPGQRVVQFISFDGPDLAKLTVTLRVEHLAMYR